MAHAQRGTHRQPLQAFDNATYVKSGHQLVGQGPYNYNPLYERSQGFDLARSFDGRHPPQLYRDDADLYAMKSAWLAAQRGIPVSGEGIWPAIPKQTQVPLPRPSQLPAVGPDRTGKSSARAGAGVNHGRTDPSTSSTTTNTTTSSSGDSGSVNSTDRSVACYACSTTSSGGSDSVLSKRRTLRGRRVARSPPPKRQGRRVSWATCAPVVMMALMMAFLLLVSLAAMARSNRVMAAVSAVGRLNVNDRKPQLVMPSAATRVTVRAPELVVRSSTSGRIADTRNMTRPRSTEKGVEGTTFAAEAATQQVTASSKHARRGKPPKRSDVPEAVAGDYENVEAGQSSEHLMAFPFQRPVSLKGPAL